MFVPGLISTGWPLIHSFTTRGGAGSPIRPPQPILGAKPAIRTTIGNAYLIIMFISNEFIHDRRLAQVPKFCPPKQATDTNSQRQSVQWVGQRCLLALK